MGACVQNGVSGSYMYAILEPVVHGESNKSTTKFCQGRLTTVAGLVELCSFCISIETQDLLTNGTIKRCAYEIRAVSPLSRSSHG